MFARGLPDPNEVGPQCDSTCLSSILRSTSTAGSIFHQEGNEELEWRYKSGFLHKAVVDDEEAYRLPSPVQMRYILTCPLSRFVLNLL
jgi:hypothetical protein